jgi:hypothetical protein
MTNPLNPFQIDQLADNTPGPGHLIRGDTAARIWSNTHGKWWAPDSNGYTPVYELAGRYPLDEAQAIVKVATAGGTRTIRRFNGAGKPIQVAPEILIPEVPA